MPLSRGFAFLLASLLLSPQASKTQVYRNDEFGIKVTIPSGVLYCVLAEYQHDHGPVFLLGSSDPSACDDLDHQRYVLIFASYNAVEETKKLHDFLKEQCAGVGGGPCDPSVPSINYDVGLHTTARYLDEDLRIFRAVLNTVRLAPPP